jgi:hypothetical protein
MKNELTVTEHNLKLTADPLTMKIIAEAISAYVENYPALVQETTINDFRFNMEAAYQNFYELDQDDWGYTHFHQQVVWNEL